MGSSSLSEDDIKLLNEPLLAILSTHMKDGSIQSTPVWVDTDGTHVLINTAKGRVKHRNLIANTNVAITVYDPSNLYRWVSVRGKADFVDEGADEHIDRLAKKYLGVDSYPMRQPGEERVTVRISPEHVLHMGG
jgi:PPOX class probable F420-dependent enzyme